MSVSPKPNASSRAAAPAYWELVNRKPPANIDGLLSLVSDLRKENKDILYDYSELEKRRLTQSEAGQRLARAVRECEGLRQQWKQKVAAYGGTETNSNNYNNNNHGSSPPSRTNPIAPGAATAQQQQQQQQQQRFAIQEATYKYWDCLTRLSCNRQWEEYKKCWTGVVDNLFMTQLSPLQQVPGRPGLEVPCQQERHALERCVGNLVTSTVQSLHYQENHNDIGLGWERRADPLQ